MFLRRRERRRAPADLRVAIIEPVGGHGGSDYYDFALCEGLYEAGVDVSLHTCDETSRKATKPYEVCLPYQAIYGDDPVWLRAIRYVRGSILALLRARLNRAQTAHFHLFHVGPLQLFDVLLAKLLRLKVVITAHDVQPFAESLSVPWMVRRAYRLADRIIAHNALSRRELEVVLQVPEDKIIEIPHGNYLPSIGRLPARSEARTRLGIAGDGPVLLFFGQIKEVKGLDHLLQAMPRLLEKYPDAILIIAGKVWKTDFRFYEEQIKALGISQSCVLHIRYIPDSEVADYYAAADLVVLPYKKIYQSGVLIMAMSYSKPVVVSDIEGMTELISDGINGYVFKAGDAEALANKLTDALSAPEESRLIGRRAWLYVQEHHDWRKIGQMTAECYRSALRDGRCDYGR